MVKQINCAFVIVILLNFNSIVLSDLGLLNGLTSGLGDATKQLTTNVFQPNNPHPQQQQTTTTTTTTQRPVSCTRSKTFVTGKENEIICKGQIIFEENFERLKDNIWKRAVEIPSGTEDAEFVSYQHYPENCYVENGKLIILPKLLTSYPRFNEDRLRMGELNLDPHCTGISSNECLRRAGGQAILPPVVSCKVNTKTSFSFKYGKIEIRAKFPKGDWIIPQLHLEPLDHHYYGVQGYASGQMRVGMIRSNEVLYTIDDSQIDGYRLYGGLVVSPRQSLRNVWMKNHLAEDHFGDDFHNYTLTWSNELITLACDGLTYGTIRANLFKRQVLTNNITAASSWSQTELLSPFDKEFFISFGVGVGGFSDFPDLSLNGLEKIRKPWNNTSPKAELNFWQNRNDWYSTWNGLDAAMEIDSVKVWAL